MRDPFSNRRRFICGLALTFFLTSASSSAFADNEYVFILKARGNPYWTAVVDGIHDAAKSNHIEATIYQLSSDSAAEEQLNVCMTAIEHKPKLIAISSVTPSVGMQCLKKAAAAGIVGADMDKNISVDDAKVAGFELAYSVGSDNFLLGQEAADYINKAIEKNPLNVLVLEGSAGSIPGQKRADGFRSELLAVRPESKVTSISADWDRLKAVSVTSDMLTRQPDTNLIYAVNDLMALGAVEAVRSTGSEGKVQIIGIDGTADAREAIEQNKLLATVAQLPYLIGKRAVELGFAAVNQGKTGITEVTPTPVLDKAVLSANRNPVLTYAR